ncbi:MAG: flagellar biosynthetic protein FliO [Acidobacteriota bacterium]
MPTRPRNHRRWRDLLFRPPPVTRTVVSWSVVLGLALLLLRRTASAAAAPVTAAPGGPEPDLLGPGGASVAGRMIVGLLAVLALMGIGAAVLRLQARGKGRGPGSLTLLSRLSLARGAQAVVVKVGERTLLLGVTGNAVSLLDDLGDLPDAPDRDSASSFARSLDTAVRRLGGGGT